MIAHVLVAGLCGWRIASLFVDEAGPFDIFIRLRKALGANKFGHFEDVTDFFPGLFSCIACLTVWTSTAAWLAWYIHPAVPGVVAAMSIAVAWERIVGGKDA